MALKMTKGPLLIVSPQAGFGNRLRSMASLILLSEHIPGCKIAHVWDKKICMSTSLDHPKSVEPWVCVSFEDIFESQDEKFPCIDLMCAELNIDVVFSEWVHGDHWFQLQSNAQSFLLQKEREDKKENNFVLKKSNNPSEEILSLMTTETEQEKKPIVLVETSLEYYLPSLSLEKIEESISRIYSTYFKPKIQYQEKLEKFIESFTFGLNWCGIHLRCGDFEEFFPETKISLTETIGLIQAILHVHNYDKFFLATDDDKLREIIHQVFGAQCFIVNHKENKEDVKNSKTENAFMDFLCLSRSKHIYCSADSSFSKAASIFGKVPLTKLSMSQHSSTISSLCPTISPLNYTSQFSQDRIILETFFPEEIFNYYKRSFTSSTTTTTTPALSQKKKVFVDIGAHDGISYSNTYVLEKQLGWEGLCVEAISSVAEACQKNRSCSVICACLNSEDGPKTFLELHPNKTMLTTSTSSHYFPFDVNMFSGIESTISLTDKQRLQHAASLENYEVVRKTVYAIRTQNIFNHYNISHIDFMSLDTEGSELFILQGIDFSKVYIHIIAVEDNVGNPNSKPLQDFLSFQGYTQKLTIGHDRIFVKNKNTVF